MSLHKHGVGVFVLSTPQNSARRNFVTLSLLGSLFPIFRLLTANSRAGSSLGSNFGELDFNWLHRDLYNKNLWVQEEFF